MRILFILGMICLSTLLGSCAPFIQRDPTAPNFAETQFVLEDYAHFDDFREIMKTLFPIGTPKEKFDYVLVERNKTSINEHPHYEKAPNRKLAEGEKAFIYSKMKKGLIINCKFIIVAVYDSTNRLSKEIDGYYGCKA
ncbi:MAG TPA: hypothetical protein PLW48_07125 [Alphaproteobacteria bacterium]|nr:hypothetical protein [Alphaproteobacteria bacterium]